MRKITSLFISIIMVLTSVFSVYANDNATSGNGDVTDAVLGYYLSREYMYKVSLYVGLDENCDETHGINGNYKMIGDEPLYIKPDTFGLPDNTIGTMNNKIDYLNGSDISVVPLDQYVTDKNVPKTPITNYGNISSVKSYFGDTNTLNLLIDSFAEQKSVSRDGLVSGTKFKIDGVWDYQDSKDILPYQENGVYTNKVPWLIVYEPVIIMYLAPDANGYRQPIAYTATEFAMDQRDGYFNWFYDEAVNGQQPQKVASCTHSDLPNSIVLEEDWVGLTAYTPLPDGDKWSNDRIIKGGGIGMRMLKPGQISEISDGDSEVTYRTDTDVYTTVDIFAMYDDITPNKNHMSEDTRDSFRSDDNKAYVTFTTSTGYTETVPIVLPSDETRQAWIKWHTPLEPGTVTIDVSISGNDSAMIKGFGRTATFTATIEELVENTPPDTKATDKMPIGYSIPKMQKFRMGAIDTTNWNTYSAVWEEDLVWQEYWVEVKDEYIEGQWIDDGYDSEGNPKEEWEDGYWTYKEEDQGWMLDKGQWIWGRQDYSATLRGDVDVRPDDDCQTDKKFGYDYIMKSGYGIHQVVDVKITDETGMSTDAQNVVTYFPEFNYEEYFRILEETEENKFEFATNKYSIKTHDGTIDRIHFTPLPFPDGEYNIWTKVEDVWTPGGELSIDLTDRIKIEGNVYEDWRIVPMDPDEE